MQTLQQIRQMLEEAGLAPQKRFGQNFLFDHNLMGKLLDLAELTGQETVLEVGPGTGSLTEELLERAGRVIAVEIDNGLFRLLSSHFAGREHLTLIHTDALAGKHAISPQVLQALAPRARLVSNLPYNVATPLVAQCLVGSWMATQRGEGSAAKGAADTHVLFDRLVFTVQQEVAERFTASVGTGAYGPVSILVSLLGSASLGPVVPNTSFWPKPQVVSRMVRIDFDIAPAAQLRDILALKALLLLTFTQRRKQVGSTARRKNTTFAIEHLLEALDECGIDRTLRPEQIPPEQFRCLANALAGKAVYSPFAAADLEL